MAVVHEDVVVRLEHRAENGRRDREIPFARRVLVRDDDGITHVEIDRSREIADPELRPLEIGDQRKWPTGRSLDCPNPPRALAVILDRKSVV